ncbi:hypothetical protein GQ457_17G007880 [Hibiscus cannabinus]
MDWIEMRMQNQEAALKYLENQVGKISQVHNTKPLGGFPSDTEDTKGSLMSTVKPSQQGVERSYRKSRRTYTRKTLFDNTNASVVPDKSTPTDTIPVAIDPDQAIPHVGVATGRIGDGFVFPIPSPTLAGTVLGNHH